MNLSMVDKIVKALLYEGYILYPYRSSAVKNQQRWNFGALYPRSYSETQNGSDPWRTETQCLAEADSQGSVDVRVRFLHLLTREVGASIKAASCEDHRLCISDLHFRPVTSLTIGDRAYQSWQEAVERDVGVERVPLRHSNASKELTLNLPGSEAIELLRDGQGRAAGVVWRRQHAVSGIIYIAVEELTAKLFKITVSVSNQTTIAVSCNSRDEALARSLLSTHTILTATGCEFVSLLDPPEPLRNAASSCSNIGTWPVLVGEKGDRNCLLSSPIILYDYPEVAPESTGDLFDSTEIDEILTLRILTLTDEEKREMRETDERAREILDLAESLPPEQLMKLHGVLRSLG